MSKIASLKKKVADLEKKQPDKAIPVYLELLAEMEQTPEELDVALFNRAGDLLLKANRTSEAVDCYEKAVDFYAEGGFFNNAIALCNKILRTSPGRSTVYYKLGRIAAHKGFKADAKQNFLEYADRMQKAGKMDEAFRALAEFADLCPDQTDIRLMLSDQLAKAGRRNDAVEQLQILHEQLVAEGRGGEAQAAADRLRAIDPSIEPRTGGSGRSHHKSGDLVFLDLGDAATPASVRRSMAKRATHGLKLLDTGEQEAAAQTSSPAASAAPAAPAKPAPRVTVPVRPPASPAPPARPSAPAPPRPSSAAPAAPAPAAPAAPRPSSAPSAAGSPRAPAAPSRPTAPSSPVVPPAAPRPAAPRPSVPVARPPQSAAPKAPAPPAPPPPAPVDESPPLILEPLMPEESNASGDMSSLLGFESTSLGGASETHYEIDAGSLLEPTPPEDAQSYAPDAVEPEADAPADANTLDLILPDGAEEPPAPPQRSSRAVEAVADTIDLQFEPELSQPAEEEPAEEQPTEPLADLPLMETGFDEPAAIVEDLPRSSALETQSVEMLQAAIEGDPEDWGTHRALAEALLEQGDRDGGVRELETAMLGYERSGDLAAAMSVADEIVRIDPSSVKHHQKRVEYAYRANDRALLVESYLSLADALFRTGQVDKSRTIYQRVLELSPDDVRAQAALSAMPETPPEPPAEERRAPKAAPRPATAPPAPRRERKSAAISMDDSFINLGDMLREDDAPKDTRMVVAEEEPTGDEEADFADMLRKFKAGIAENVEDEDYQSHYDLGVAYKEMGLVDEAIAEFQKALRAPQGRVRTYEAIGQCFLEKNQHQMAATILTRALSEPGMDDDQLVGVLYLLGRAYEALGRGDDAMQFYQRVFVVDIQFRDVADRLSALENAAR